MFINVIFVTVPPSRVLGLGGNINRRYTEQVRKVLWIRKAPACLLTLVYAYGKLRMPPVHKYSSLRSTAHRAAPGRCARRSAPAV